MAGKFYLCAIKACSGAQNERIISDLREVTSWLWQAQHMVSVRKGPKGKRYTEWEARPMWPGYIFAKMDGDQFAKARAIKEFYDAGDPLDYRISRRLRVLARQLDDKMQADMKRIKRKNTPPVAFTVGQRLEILDGLFEGRTGEYINAKTSGDGSIYAVMQIDEMTTPLQVPIGEVGAVT